MKKRIGVLVVYIHLEGLPPALNAIELLSRSFDELIVVYRNAMKSDWTFPSNVQLATTGEYCYYVDAARKSFLWKLKTFLSFTALTRKIINERRPDWLMIHDPNGMLAWQLVKPFAKNKPRVWYHNHDVIVGNESFLFYWAFKAQRWLFHTLQKFSLPANERKEYFPMEKFKGDYHFIPNYPGKYFYDRFYTVRKLTDEVRIIYQGSISDGHGLTELLPLLRGRVGKFQLRLVLKGFMNKSFYARLMALATELGVADKIEVHDPTSYKEVPKVASTCHIGIGIHTKTDIMNKTLGTASNKIYEYAALGLPVLLYDNPHFKEHLGHYKWAFFTNCETENYRAQIEKIIASYEQSSTLARADFERDLNFEFCFLPVAETLFPKK